MGYVSDATIAALKAGGNLGLFFRLGTAPALHLSFGVNDVPITLPSYDDPGTVYLGAGRLVDIPQFEALINGLSDKVTFSLSGIDPVEASYMLDSAPEVLGARTTIGMAMIDARWQPIGSIIGLWTGTADYVSEKMDLETDVAKNRVQSIMLTTSTGDASRAFPNLLTYTDAVQRAMHPTDAFFQRVSRYVQTYLVSWPRF